MSYNNTHNHDCFIIQYVIPRANTLGGVNRYEKQFLREH